MSGLGHPLIDIRAFKCMPERVAMGCVCVQQMFVGVKTIISCGKFCWFCLVNINPFLAIQ